MSIGIPQGSIEALFFALRAERLPDLVTRRQSLRVLAELGLAHPEDPDPRAPAYAAIRRALADHFPTDAQWSAAHQELHRIEQIALEWYPTPGAIEARAPGFSAELYRRLYADTAFAMR